MPHYRCYILNASDNIVSVDSVEADEDPLAMSLAGGLLRERYRTFAAIEVWSQKKLVGRINSEVEKPSDLQSLLKAPKPTSQTGSN
jgi:hypothetical protein